ncbi:MAG: prolipoprotein diacylglyceryl transferase [Planctomycetaceae bacterium]
MRQTLIRIFLDEPWAFWKVDAATGYPGPGVGIALLVVMALWAGFQLMRRRSPAAPEQRSTLMLFGIGLIAVNFAPRLPFASFPVFGYGFMLLVGFLTAVKIAERRARREGLEPTLIMDLAFWLLIAGIGGARLFYLVQYSDRVFGGKQGLGIVTAALNLSQGGLVLFGGLLGGAAAYFLFCYRRGIHPLQLGDIATPSVFIGIGFGRIGCLLNGCCWGGRCELPWAITFPQGSVPWQAMVERGLLDPASPATFSLHPTQIYSSINAFLLAWVVTAFYSRRRHDGETFALGCILYAITRFTIEALRNDELGQFGTSLTISQWVSIGILITGLGVLAFVNRRPVDSLQTTATSGR